MSEERGKTMTNVNRIVAESNKVVRYINGNSIAEVYAKQEAHSAGVYISLTERILNGEDYKQAIADMKKEWCDYCEEHVFDN